MFNIDSVDADANEICLDDKGVSENTYSIHHPKGQKLLSLAIGAHPQLAQDHHLLERADIIGLTLKDGRSYFENVISLTFTEPPSHEQLQAMGAPEDINCIDCFTLKLGLQSGRVYYKVYDGDIWRYPLPCMPKGWRLAHRFGIGRHFASPEHEPLRDLYFFHTDAKSVYSHFQFTSPEGVTTESESALKLFGLTYRLHTSLKVVKLKRYWYPNDPYLMEPEKI